MALTTEQLIEEIKQMSVLDLSTLVKALEEEFGVSAAAAVAVAAGIFLRARRSQHPGNTAGAPHASVEVPYTHISG